MQRFLRLADVSAQTGLAKSTVYYLMDRDAFPKPIRLSEGRVGWVEAEIKRWIDQRIADRDGGQEAA